MSSSTHPSRNVTTFGLLFGAVIFGMVLAGGLDLSATGAAAPAAAAVRQAAPRRPRRARPRSRARSAASYLPSFADLAEKVLPAVVSIEAQTIEKADARRIPGHGGGRRIPSSSSSAREAASRRATGTASTAPTPAAAASWSVRTATSSPTIT